MKRIISTLMLFCAVNLIGATYFVDPTNGDNSNAGTSTATAWKHCPGMGSGTGSTWTYLSGGAGWPSLIPSGSTVVFKGGEINRFSLHVDDNSGSFPGKWTLTTASKSYTLISGHLYTPQWGTTRAVFDLGFTNNFGIGVSFNTSPPYINGVNIVGFEVRNVRAGGVLGSDDRSGNSCILLGHNEGCNYHRVALCWLHDSQRLGLNQGHGIEAQRTSYNVIESNIVGGAIGTKGIEFTGSGVPNLHNVVRYNFIYDCGDHGMSLGLGKSDVYNNFVYHSGREVLSDVYGFKMHANCGVGNAWNDIWNNVVYVPTAPYIYGKGPFSNWTCCTSNRWFYNTAFGGRGPDGNEAIWGIGAGGATYGTIWENNIITHHTNSWSTTLNLQLWVWSGSSYNSIKYNNIWTPPVGIGGSNVIWHAGYAEGVSVPAWQNASSLGGNTVANNVQIDPKYKGGSLPTDVIDRNANFAPNTEYFKLTSDTDASIRATGNHPQGNSTYGHNTAAGKFDLDILGVTRTTYSMGAYEYGTPTTAIFTVTPTTNYSTVLTNSVPDATSFTIRNTGDTSQSITYSNFSSAAWLVSALAGGTVSTAIVTNAVSLDLSGLSAGAYSAWITNYAWTNTVYLDTKLYGYQLTVTNGVDPGAAVFSYSPTNANVSCITNTSPSPSSYSLWNSGNNAYTIQYYISTSAVWLASSAVQGTLDSETDTITITYSTGALSQGSYTGYVTNRASTNAVFFKTNIFQVNLTVGGGTEPRRKVFIDGGIP